MAKAKKALPILTIQDEVNDSVRRFLPVSFMWTALQEIQILALQGDLKATAAKCEELINEIK